MKFVLLVGVLFSVNVFSQEKFNCGEKILKEIQDVPVKARKDFKKAQLTMIKGIPCLGKEKYKEVNVAVFKLYSKMSLLDDYPQAFEILYPYYERYKDFFEKSVLVKLSKDEKKIIQDHYEFIKFQLENGNG